MKNGLKVVVTFGKATVAVLVAMVAVVVVGEVKVVVEVEDEVDANVDANVEVLNVDVAGAEVVWCCAAACSSSAAILLVAFSKDAFNCSKASTKPAMLAAFV